MSQKKKNVVCGAIIALCAVVMLGQWMFAASRKLPPPATTDAAATAPAAMVAQDGAAQDFDAGGDQVVGSEPAEAARAATASPEALEHALQSLENIDAPGRRADLDELARGWQEAGAGLGRAGRDLDAADVLLDPLEAFLADHPLTGIICGESTRTALFGGYVVRAGDELPGTGHVVDAIESRSVQVAAAGGVRVIALPAYQPKPREAQAAPASATPAQAAPAAQPAAAPATPAPAAAPGAGSQPAPGAAAEATGTVPNQASSDVPKHD